MFTRPVNLYFAHALRLRRATSLGTARVAGGVATPSSNLRRLFARRGYHATGITELCEANDLGRGRARPLHRAQRGAPGRHPRPGHGRGMACAEHVAQTGGSPSVGAGHARRRAARHHPPLSRPRLGLPHEFPALTDERADRFRTGARAYEERIEEVLRAGVASGEFTATSTCG